MNVVVADDSDLIRSRVIKLLSQIPNTIVVGEAKNGIEAERIICDLKPHLAVIDIRMPGKSGIEVAKSIKESIPGIKIFILTNYYDAQSISTSKNSGADYVFDKSSEFDLLVKFATLYSELE